MIIGRDEALAIFRVWAEDGVLLRCDVAVGGMVAVLWGRVRRVGDEALVFAGDDGRSEWIVPIAAVLACGYDEPRDFPAEAAVYARAVILSVAPARAGEPSDLSFTEVTATPPE